MKNTVSKGILFYILTLLGVILGVACIIVAIMLFSPGTEIFGISYFHDNHIIYISKVDADNAKSETINNLIKKGQLDTLNITTNYIDFTIETDNTDEIRLIITGKISGLIKSGNNREYLRNYAFDSATRSFNIDIKGPDLSWFFSENAKVILSIPFEADLSNLNINIKTENGLVTFGYNSNDDYTLNSVNIKSEKSNAIDIGNKVNIVDSVIIECPSGEIDLDTTTTTTNCNLVKVITDSAKIKASDIGSKQTILITNSSTISLGNLNGDLVYDARKGVINAKKITGKFSCSEDVVISNITIDTVFGGVLLPSAETSNITINKLYGYSLIRTSSGTISIGKLYSTAIIETNSGTINVGVQSEKQYLNNEIPNTTQIKVNENGTLNVNFYEILGQNLIEVKSGNINLNYNNTQTFVLNFNCQSHVPTFSSGIYNAPSTNSGRLNINCSDSVNKISLNNISGNTNISDTLEDTED